MTNRDVRAWMLELKRIFNDAEDLLDEITVSGALVGSGEQGSGIKIELQYAGRVREMLNNISFCLVINLVTVFSSENMIV